MRRLLPGLFAVALLTGSIAVGCGDSSGTTGTAGGSGGGGGGVPGNCVEIDAESLKLLITSEPDSFAYYEATLAAPGLGGADLDLMGIEVYDLGLTGSVDLGDATNNNYISCQACVRVLEDSTDMGPARDFFQAAGTLELGATTPFYIAGTLTDVTLVEVTIAEDFTTTPVPGGACLHIASYTFDIPAPPTGWVCPPEYYEDGMGCDCNECGAHDPDCDVPTLPSTCLMGQTCGTTGSCEGTPTAWMCAGTEYDAGAGNGCDCNCGAYDPDCDLVAEAVQGCTGAETCSSGGFCFDAAVWSCEDTFFGTGQADDCDCGCGVADPDCADAAVATCDFCDDAGSCNLAACPGTINPTNNAVCN